MSTFQEVYDRGEVPYMLAAFRRGGVIIDCFFDHNNIPWYAVAEMQSDSYAEIGPHSNYGNNKYEYYATLDALTERLKDVLNEILNVNTKDFACRLSTIRMCLKKIYKET